MQWWEACNCVHGALIILAAKAPKERRHFLDLARLHHEVQIFYLTYVPLDWLYWLVFNSTFNLLARIVAASFIAGGNLSTRRNFPTCIHICSGWRHVIISTMLWEGGQLQIGPGRAATQTFHLRGQWHYNWIKTATCTTGPRQLFPWQKKGSC